MKRIFNILLLLLVVLGITSCDATIHEYPKEEEKKNMIMPIILNLDFDTALPLYQVIETATRSRAELSDEMFDLRYKVNVYPAVSVRQFSDNIAASFTFTKADVGNWDFSTEIELEEGTYKFVVWADYVNAGETTDKYYDTSDFTRISIIGDIPGSNDYRDAFAGDIITTITRDTENIVTVNMVRPMAKYRFVSIDLESFISRMTAMKLKEMQQRNEETKGNENSDTPNNPDSGSDSNGGDATGEDTKSEDTKGEDDDTKGDTKVTIDLDDYYAVFHYPKYVNISYNAVEGRPATPGNNLSYRSKIRKINDSEAEIGFDYVFVNGASTEVEISIEIFQNDGTNVAGVKSDLYPIVRSKLTEIRGKFLTSQADGGVGINPDFDGGWDIVIPDL